MCKESLNCLLTEKCTNEESIRADERAKTIEECKEILEEYRGPVAYRMIDKIRKSLEQLKGKQND